MNSITPSSPLLSLTIKPKEGVSEQQILARFHPIMKSMGFGNFEMEEQGFYQASKSGGGVFGSELFVFAEVFNGSVIINIDGHSIFGLKGVEVQLKKIQSEYESSIDCQTKLEGPNYSSAFLNSIIYTALPIYTSTTFIAWVLHNWASDFQLIANTYLYATIILVGAKTRFWVNQRRKQRPIWLSVLFLLLIAPVILGIISGLLWLAQNFG